MRRMIQQFTEKYEWARIADVKLTEESIYFINMTAIAKLNLSGEKIAVPTKEKEMNKVAEKCLAFLSGLNLQDHSVEDQRKQREIIKDLMHAINPGKASK